MTIILGPEHEKLVADAVLTGAYANADEVICRALEMLVSEEEWLQGRKSILNHRIERALAQFESGEFLSAEESRSLMEISKAQWIAKQHR